MKKLIAYIISVVMICVSGGFETVAQASKYASMIFATKSVSAGFYNAAAIKNDGTAWVWGFNEKNAFGNDTFENSNVPIQIEGVENAKSIDIDMYNTVILTENGDVYVTGDNSYGQFANNSSQSQAVKINSLSNVLDVQTSFYHIEENGEIKSEPYVMALDALGNIWAWGANKNGLLGTGKNDDILYTPTQVDISSVASFSVSGSRFSALKYDGTVFQWGYVGTEFYDVNEKNSELVSQPQKIEGLSDIVQISVGSHLLALDKNGKVYGLGNNDYKQLCYNPSSNEPCEIPEISKLNITQVYAGRGYSFFHSDDDVLYASGSGCNLFSDADYENYTYPVRISAPDNLSDISVGESHIIASTSQNEVFTWGNQATFGAFGAEEHGAFSNVPVKSKLNSIRFKAQYAVSNSSDGVLKIENICLCDSSGQPLNEIDNSFFGNVKLEIISGKQASAMITFAVYETEENSKTLVCIESKNIDFDSIYTGKFDINVESLQTDKNYIVKLFIWDLSSGLMDPYFSKSFEF